MARSINHPAGAIRSINDGPPFFSIASTATAYQNLGNTGMSVCASGQALANALASSVAWGDEEPIANPAFSMLSPMIGVQLLRLDVFKTTINFFFCLTLPPSFIELRTRYIKHAVISRCTRPNTDKQQNSKKRLHGIFSIPKASRVVTLRGERPNRILLSGHLWDSSDLERTWLHRPSLRREVFP